MFKHQDLEMLGLKLNQYMINFHPLEVVDCGNTPNFKWMNLKKNYIVVL